MLMDVNSENRKVLEEISSKFKELSQDTQYIDWGVGVTPTDYTEQHLVWLKQTLENTDNPSGGLWVVLRNKDEGLGQYELLCFTGSGPKAKQIAELLAITPKMVNWLLHYIDTHIPNPYPETQEDSPECKYCGSYRRWDGNICGNCGEVGRE